VSHALQAEKTEGEGKRGEEQTSPINEIRPLNRVCRTDNVYAILICVNEKERKSAAAIPRGFHTSPGDLTSIYTILIENAFLILRY